MLNLHERGRRPEDGEEKKEEEEDWDMLPWTMSLNELSPFASFHSFHIGPLCIFDDLFSSCLSLPAQSLGQGMERSNEFSITCQ